MAFITRENHLRRLLQLPSNKGRIHFADAALLSTEATADTGLGHAHHGLGDVQSVGNNATAVEHDLGGADDMQATIGIDGAIGAEGLHHILLHGLHTIGAVDYNITGSQHSVHITIADGLGGTEVTLVIGTHRALCFPIVLRMH